MEMPLIRIKLARLVLVLSVIMLIILTSVAAEEVEARGGGGSGGGKSGRRGGKHKRDDPCVGSPDDRSHSSATNHTWSCSIMCFVAYISSSYLFFILYQN